MLFGKCIFLSHAAKPRISFCWNIPCWNDDKLIIENTVRFYSHKHIKKNHWKFAIYLITETIYICLGRSISTSLTLQLHIENWLEIVHGQIEFSVFQIHCYLVCCFLWQINFICMPLKRIMMLEEKIMCGFSVRYFLIENRKLRVLTGLCAFCLVAYGGADKNL